MTRDISKEVLRYVNWIANDYELVEFGGGDESNNFLIRLGLVISDEKERFDLDNDFLICSNHDALFDKGFITFNETGYFSIIPKVLDLLSEHWSYDRSSF
ncbi:hypothetical protein [Lysinibacillus capsici]|uniref:hypothetical protein n=1 Tax=Lysinibacillus capsici TaxID=2115968 RepID=UPI000E1FBEDA|nr:hypothetical protein [Lysinibacillus capsici]RDV31629.1 hypothetical protein C7B89_11505 [Lysinibacillus capsici]